MPFDVLGAKKNKILNHRYVNVRTGVGKKKTIQKRQMSEPWQWQRGSFLSQNSGQCLLKANQQLTYHPFVRKIEYHTFIDVISINVANIHGLENIPAHPVPIVDSFVLILIWIDLHCVPSCLYWEYICVNLIQSSKIIVFGTVKPSMVDCCFCFFLARLRLLMKEGKKIVPTYVAKKDEIRRIR